MRERPKITSSECVKIYVDIIGVNEHPLIQSNTIEILHILVQFSM